MGFLRFFGVFVFVLAGLCAGAFADRAHAAEPVAPPLTVIDQEIMNEIRAFIGQDIVRLSIRSQNQKYGALPAAEITRLDEQWVNERGQRVQPLIAATLSNPVSTYLTRVQAHSYGLFTEIFVMDQNGLNVGQSNISSDYWQGDEAKFQKTYPVALDAVFIDEPEYNEDLGIWAAQVNMTIAEGGQAIGAATIEVNLSELMRRRGLVSCAAGVPADSATPKKKVSVVLDDADVSAAAE